MSKFRKWLTKKLGGFTKEDLPIKPIEIKQQNVQLVPIKANHIIDEYELHNIDYPVENYENAIKYNLKKELLNYIEPEFIYEESSMGKSIMAKILIPSNYVKESK